MSTKPTDMLIILIILGLHWLIQNSSTVLDFFMRVGLGYDVEQIAFTCMVKNRVKLVRKWGKREAQFQGMFAQNVLFMNWTKVRPSWAWAWVLHIALLQWRFFCIHQSVYKLLTHDHVNRACRCHAILGVFLLVLAGCLCCLLWL